MHEQRRLRRRPRQAARRAAARAADGRSPAPTRRHAPALPARLSLVAAVDQGAAHGAPGCARIGPTCAGGARSCRRRRARRSTACWRGDRRLAARAHGRRSAARSAASMPPCVAERIGCRAVLLNPGGRSGARPRRATSASRRPGTSDERFFFRAEFIDELRALAPPRAHAPRALLRGHRQGRRGARLARDERRATPARRIQLLEGSDHALTDFDDQLPEVARLPRPLSRRAALACSRCQIVQTTRPQTSTLNQNSSRAARSSARKRRARSQPELRLEGDEENEAERPRRARRTRRGRRRSSERPSCDGHAARCIPGAHQAGASSAKPAGARASSSKVTIS